MHTETLPQTRAPGKAPDPCAAIRAELEAAGFHVFPVRAGAKTPKEKGWQDKTKVWEFGPSDNIGINTSQLRDGRCLLVLDVDVKKGKNGETTLRALEDKNGKLPTTREHVTPTEGRHIFFTAPFPIGNNACKLGDGLDIRGDGGYVVAPGSVIDGKPYRVKFDGEIKPAPQWLIEGCSARRERSTEPVKELTGYAAEVATARAIEYLRTDAPESIKGNGGDHTAYMVACRVRDFGVPEAECLELMLDHWHEGCGWSPEKLAVKVANAYHYAGGTFGGDNPAVVFEPVPPQERAPVISGGDELALRRPMAVIDLCRFEEMNLPSQRFIVDRIVPAGLSTLMGGHGGAGKSVLALAFAAHVAADRAAYGLNVEGGPAVYVSFEDDPAWMLKRLRKVSETFDLNPRAVEANLRIIDGTGAGVLMRESNAWTGALVETAAMRELRAIGADASVIFIDNATDAFDGNENARGQVRSFVRALNTLGNDQTAIVLLAHIDKNAARYGSHGNTYSGSSAWHNTTRSRVALIPVKENRVELHHEKWSRTTQMPPMRLEWSPQGVLVPAENSEGASGDENADAVLGAIAAAVRDGVNVRVARTGPATTQHVLERLPDLPQWLHGSAGRPAFWAAVAALQRSGRIQVEKYRTDQRKEAERFVVGAPVCASSAPV